MDTFEYMPTGVCAKQMTFTIENNKIVDVKTIGGCPGNALGVRALCIGQDIDEVIKRLKGIRCGFRQTSCPDHMAIALEAYKIRGTNN